MRMLFVAALVVSSIWATAAPQRYSEPYKSAQDMAGVAIGNKEAFVCGGRDGMGAPLAQAAVVSIYSARPMASLAQARFGHGIARLSDGRILVFGGRGADGNSLATSEIFDPKRGVWTHGPALRSARESFAYAKTPHGVVVAGGLRRARGKSTTLATAELFDEAAGAWRDAGKMSVPRAETGAAALGDGTVLVAGGVDAAGAVLASAERFDPRSMSWSAVAPLPGPVHRHSALALPSGEVLVVGGLRDGTRPDYVSHVFSTEKGWHDGPKLNQPRVGHSAAVAENGAVLLMGGESPLGPLSSSEVLNVAAGIAAMSGIINQNRLQRSVSIAIGGDEVLTVGGCASGFLGWGTLHLPQPAEPPAAAAAKPAGAWKYLPQLPRPLTGVGAALDGKFFVVSAPEGERRSSLWIYDPRSQSWSEGAAPPDSRLAPAAAAARGRLYLIGGAVDRKTVDTTLVYDPARDRWSYAAPMPGDRMGAAAVELEGKIYVLGGEGWTGIKNDDMSVYDPAKNTWTARRKLPMSRSHAAAAAAYGRLWLFGGDGPNESSPWNLYSRRGWSYDPSRDDWSELPQLEHPLAFSRAVVVDKKIYIVGGMTYGSANYDTLATNAAVVFDPSSRSFSAVPPLQEARAIAPTAAVGGTILVAGGGPDAKATLEAFTPGASAEALVWSDRFKRAAPPRPDDLAVIVGVSQYKALPRADFAERDARGYAAAMRALGVQDENVVTLTGDRAALADVTKYTEEWLAKRAKPSSRVYFVFSGHGAPDVGDSRPYLMPWDADASFVRSTGYSLSKLYASLGKLPAREVVVVLDSCFSGSGGRSVLAEGVRPLVHVAAPDPPKRLTIFSAAEGSETAGALPAREQGLYSYFVLDGLAGAADADGDGHVTAEELHAYARKNVAVEARKQGREQTPTLVTSDRGLRLY